MDEIVKKCYRPYIRERCEMIKLRDEFGMSLRPSRLFPVVTCGPDATADFSETGLKARDRDISQELVKWLGFVRADFPEILTEFGPVLEKAEKVWGGCIAA